MVEDSTLKATLQIVACPFKSTNLADYLDLFLLHQANLLKKMLATHLPVNAACLLHILLLLRSCKEEFTVLRHSVFCEPTDNSTAIITLSAIVSYIFDFQPSYM